MRTRCKREFFKAFSDAIKTATVKSVKDAGEMMQSYGARMQQKKAGDSCSVDFSGADISAHEPSGHVVAMSPVEWISTAMIGMPSTPPMPAADLQKLEASHGIIRVPEGGNLTIELSRLIQPDMSRSGKIEILKEDLIPGSGLSFAGQWSFNVRKFFKAFSDAIKTATVWSMQDAREMMRSYGARMQQKKAADSGSVYFRGADMSAQEPSGHVVAKSPVEWFSTAMIGMPSTPPMSAADLQKLRASHGIIRVPEGGNLPVEPSRLIQPDMPQSGKMEILQDDLIPGSGLSFARQWSYNVTFTPKDTLERMKNEFSWLRKQLPILAGIKVDLSGVAFACVREAEAKALRQAVRSERLRNSKIRPDYLEQLIVEPFDDVDAFYSVDNKTVYVVHEAVDREAEWETKSILAHELTHALQVHAFPDFHKSIGNLLSRGIDKFNESQENGLFKLQHINKSIGARLDWLERHACYFGDCAYEYLLDDERDFTGIVRYAVNERLFQLEKFHREPSKLEAEEIVASMFAIPELADLLFRDDGVVCIDERQQESNVIRKRVSEFARKFLNQEEVRFFPLG